MNGSVMNVVCYDRVCYEQVYKRCLLWTGLFGKGTISTILKQILLQGGKCKASSRKGSKSGVYIFISTYHTNSHKLKSTSTKIVTKHIRFR